MPPVEVPRVPPLVAFSEWARWQLGDKWTCRGFEVSFSSMDDDISVAAAREKIDGALELIARHDPRRFRQLARVVKRIWVTRLAGPWGQYHWRTKTCAIDDKYLARETVDSLRVASILVHEGTHGWLYQLGIDYVAPNRARIERICVRSELAFMSRFPEKPELVELKRRQMEMDDEDFSDEAMLRRTLETVSGWRPRWAYALAVWRLRRSLRKLEGRTSAAALARDG